MKKQLPKNEILVGDAKEKLEELPDNSVDTAMTSPPYWGLRDYDHEDQLGLEPTPEEYVENLMKVFNELKRVLKPTGTFYLNIDDSYNAGSGGAGQTDEKKGWDNGEISEDYQGRAGFKGLPKKCMSMVPERVMMAMVNQGWILRNKIVWNKPNPMPESVKDRFSTTWEYVYMFSLEKNYYFDLDAVREPRSSSSRERLQENNGNPNFNPNTEGRNPNGEERLDVDDLCHPSGKNPGDTWEITTKGFSEAHFAVYPPELCEKPVKAGCPKKVCSECGSPYERDKEQVKEMGDSRKRSDTNFHSSSENSSGGITNIPHEYAEYEFKGWKKTCMCDTEGTKKGVVLDPFAGAGTTGLVARRHNRDYVGIELNEDYAEMARERIRDEVGGQPLDRFVEM